MLDSVSVPGFNVVVIIIAWFIIQNIFKKTCKSITIWKSANYDDIQLCRFLVGTRFFFIGLLLFEILTLCAMLLAVLQD
jgi:hypothetical protein